MTKPIDDNCRDLFDETVVKAVLDLIREGSVDAAASIYDLTEDPKTKRFILSESIEGRPVSEIIGRTAPSPSEGPVGQTPSDFYSDMNSLFTPPGDIPLPRSPFPPQTPEQEAETARRLGQGVRESREQREREVQERRAAQEQDRRITDALPEGQADRRRAQRRQERSNQSMADRRRSGVQQNPSQFQDEAGNYTGPLPEVAPPAPSDALSQAVQTALSGGQVDYPAIIESIPSTQRRRALSRVLSDMATNDDVPVEEARRLANSIGERGLKNSVLNSNIPGTATPLIEALRRKAQPTQGLGQVFDSQQSSPSQVPGQGDIAPTDSDVFPPETSPETPREPSFADDFYGNFGQGGHFIVPSFAPPKPVTVSGGKQIPTPEDSGGEPDIAQLRALADNALAQEEAFLNLRARSATGDQAATEALAEQGQKFREAVLGLTQVEGIHNEVEASAVFLDLKRRKLLSEISELPDGPEKREKIKQRVEVENALHNLAYGENSPEAERILNAERGAEETDVLVAVNQIEDALNNPREVESIEQGIAENRAKATQVNRLIDQLKSGSLNEANKQQLSNLFEAKRQLASDYNKLVRERSISAGTADNARLNKLSSEISQIQNRLGEGQERTPEQQAKDERRLQDLTGELLLRYNNLARSGRAVDLAVEDEDGDRSDRVFAKNAKEMTDRVLAHENNQFNSAEELEVLPSRYENSIGEYLSSNGGRAIYQHARLFPESEFSKVFEFDLVGDDGASRSVARRRFTALQQLMQNPEELSRLGLNNLDRARMEFQKDLYRFNLPREQGGHWKDEAGRIFYRPFEEDPDVIAEADTQTEAMNSLISNSLEKHLSSQDLIQLKSKKISPDASEGDFLYPKALYEHLAESGQFPKTQFGELYKVFGAIAHVWEDKKQGITAKDNPLVQRAAQQILGDVKATENFVNRALPEPTNPGELLSRNRRTLGRLARGVRLPSKDYVDRIDSGETIPRIDIPIDTPQEHVARNYGISWGTARDNFLTQDITGLVDYNSSLNQDLIDAERAYLEDNPDVDEVRRATYELDAFLFNRLQENPGAPVQEHQRAVLDFAKQVMESEYMQQFMNRWLSPTRREIRNLEQEIASTGTATPAQARRLEFLNSSLAQKGQAAKVRIPQSLLERGEAWLDSDPLFQDISRAVGGAEEGQMVRYPEERGVLDSKVKENRRKLAQENIIDDIKSFEGSSDKVIGSIKPQYALAPAKRGQPQSDDTLAQLLDVEREPIDYSEARLHPTWQLTPYMEYQNSPELVSEINQYLNNLADKTRIEGSAGGRRLLWDRTANALQAKLLLKENRDRALSLLDRNNNRDFDSFIDRLARQALQEQYGTERIEGTMDSERAAAAREVYEDRLVPGEDHRFYNEKTMEGMGVQKPALKYEKPIAPSLFEAAGMDAPDNRYEELVQNLKDRSRVLLRGTPNEASLPEMAAAHDLTNLILAAEDRDNLVEEPRSPLAGLRGQGSGPSNQASDVSLDASSIDPTVSPEEGRAAIEEVVGMKNPARALDILSHDIAADLADLRATPGRTASLQEGRTKKLAEMGTPETYTPFRIRMDYFADGLAESLMQSSPETARRLANDPDSLENTLLQRVQDRVTDEEQAGRPGLSTYWNGRSDTQKVEIIRDLAARFRVRTLPKSELSPADDSAAERIVEQERFADLQLTPDPSREGVMRILVDSVERAQAESEAAETPDVPERGRALGGKAMEFITGIAEAFYGGGGGGANGGNGGGGMGGAQPPQPPAPPTGQTPTDTGQVDGQTAAGQLNDINIARQLLRSIQAGVPAGMLVLDPRLTRQITDVLDNSLPRSARGRQTYLNRLQDSLIDAVNTIEQKQAALPENAQKRNALAALMKQRRVVEMVLRLITGLF